MELSATHGWMLQCFAVLQHKTIYFRVTDSIVLGMMASGVYIYTGYIDRFGFRLDL